MHVLSLPTLTSGRFLLFPGPVFIDFSVQRPDLTAVDVPEECVGFVTGRGGAVLRGLEEEWGTLMFFAKVRLGVGVGPR